jgi:hypothetical protein
MLRLQAAEFDKPVEVSTEIPVEVTRITGLIILIRRV